MAQVMQNVEFAVAGHTLTIKIDLSKSFGPSKTGKTIVVASTKGNAEVPGHEHIKVGLNAYYKQA